MTITSNDNNSKFTIVCDLSELELLSKSLHEWNAHTRQTNDLLEDMAQTTSDAYFETKK